MKKNQSKDREDIIAKADELVLSEIKKYIYPRIENNEIVYKKSQELAEKLSADKDIVALGVRFMDLKLGQALAENRLAEHIKMSAEASKDFFSQFDLDKEFIDKVLTCINEHHNKVWTSRESEICANADAYRFLNVNEFLKALVEYTNMFKSFDKGLQHSELKIDEKWKTLSIDICKKELEPEYILLKEVIKRARPK